MNQKIIVLDNLRHKDSKLPTWENWRQTALKSAEELGIQVQFADQNEFLENSLKHTDWGDVFMLGNSIVSPKKYQELYEKVCNAGKLFFDLPEHVDIAYSMQNFYPLLKKIGIPMPKTALIEYAPGLLENEELFKQTIKSELEEKLAKEKISISKNNPVFVKTFFSSWKTSNPEDYLERNINELVESAWVGSKLQEYSGAIPGGLAVREFVPLKMAYKIQRSPYRYREFRFMMLCGKPICWATCNPITEMDYAGWTAPEPVLNSLHLSQAELERIKTILLPVGNAIKSNHYGIDLAFTEKGDITLIELNPGYATRLKSQKALIANQLSLFTYLKNPLGKEFELNIAELEAKEQKINSSANAYNFGDWIK